MVKKELKSIANIFSASFFLHFTFQDLTYK